MASAIRLTLMYWPSYRIEPLMSITTQVAHLGVLRVRWISMSSWCSRSRRVRCRRPVPAAQRHVHERLRESTFAIESPNSYGLVVGSSTAPSPSDRPLMPALRDACKFAEELFEQLALKDAVRLRREFEIAARLLEALPLGRFAQVILHLLLQRAELVNVPRLGELARAGPCRSARSAPSSPLLRVASAARRSFRVLPSPPALPARSASRCR